MTTLIVRRAPLGAPRQQLANARAALGVPLNVVEDAEGYTVTALLPGLTAETIDLHLNDRTLTISGELRLPEPAEGATYRLRELAEGRFERSLQFASPLDGGAIDARYTHGVLQLRLPKAASARLHRIPVATPALIEQ